MKNKIISIITLAIFLFSMTLSPSISAIETTFTFDFGDYEDGWETNPGYMCDGNEYTFASTTDRCDFQYLTTGMSFEDEGEISKVELRVKANWSGAEADIVIQPVFGGSANGDLHPFDCTNSASWSSWFNITNDTNAHSFWTWNDIEDLCCNITVGDHSSGFTLYCSMVQVRVTYERI
jgi:hypothetical protein